jgi:hypothetical protein
MISVVSDVLHPHSLIRSTFIGGELFTDRLPEQKAILDMLKFSDTEHAWPTIDIQERLKEAWGWQD